MPDDEVMFGGLHLITLGLWSHAKFNDCQYFWLYGMYYVYYTAKPLHVNIPNTNLKMYTQTTRTTRSHPSCFVD